LEAVAMPAQKKTEPQNFKITREGNRAKILMYGIIHEWSENNAQDVAEQIADLAVDQIDLEIHSRGGSVLEGVAIYNALKEHPARVEATVMGAALSIASYIVMAADKIRMPKNAFLMIHRPRMVAIGESDELRNQAEMLDQMQETIVETYAERTGQSKEAVAEMLQPRKETWLRAPEALDKGFCDELIEPIRMAAGPLDLTGFDNVPDWAEALLLSDSNTPPTTPAKPTSKGDQGMPDTNEPKAATLAELKAEFPDASAEFYMGQIEAESTITQAAVNYAKACKAEADEAKKAADAAKKEAENAAKKKTPDGLGVEPLNGGGDGDDDDTATDPVAEFHTAVCKLMDRGVGRREAVALVCQRKPELHQRFTEATNAKTKTMERAIESKFELMGAN